MGKIYTALGLMSGTSMDGVDASIIQTDGKAQYVTVDGDLNGAGTWSVQVLIVTSGGLSHNTTVATFRVFENI